MKRLLLLMILVACVLLCAGRAPALSILLPVEEQLPPLDLKSQSIEVTIEETLARTTIEQVFANPYPRPIEGVFLLTLPEDAQVTDFVMEINGERVHAAVLGADEARRTYMEIVRRVRDPGLLEYVNERTFRVRVFPIPASGEMPVEVSFAQPLKREGDYFTYELPGVGPRVPSRETDAKLRVDLKWRETIGSVYSPTHPIDTEMSEGGTAATVSVPDYRASAAQPFRLSVAPARKGVGLYLLAERPSGDESGTFMLSIDPPREGEGAAPLPKTVTFVLDVSGSMNEEGKIAKARDALVQALGGLAAEDFVNIITFSTGVDSWKSEPVAATAENIRAAQDFVRGIRANGGTNIGEAMRRALGQSSPLPFHQIVFLTDGRPTVSVTDPHLLLRQLEEENSTGLRFFTVGFGYDVNVRLLDDIAAATNALPTYIEPQEDIEVKVGALYDSIAYPVMTNLALSFGDAPVFDVYPPELPDLFKGRELRVFGRYREAGAQEVVLTGMMNKTEVRQEYALEFPESTAGRDSGIAALWARRKVGYLLDEIRRNGESQELRDEIVALAEKHNLVTPYTSYLIVDDAEMPATRLTGRVDTILRDREFLATLPTPAPDQRQITALMSAILREDDEAAPRGYAPQSGTVSRGSISRLQAGEAEMLRSRAIIGMKSAETNAAGSVVSGVRMVDGDKFVFGASGWVQQDIAAELKTVEVAFLSDAYFALIERFPEKSRALSLGERVTLVINGVRVAIGDKGIESASDLPAELAEQ